MMILELHQQGLSVSAIAERTGHGRKTMRKVIERGLAVPKYAARAPRPTRLGPYEAYRGGGKCGRFSGCWSGDSAALAR